VNPLLKAGDWNGRITVEKDVQGVRGMGGGEFECRKEMGELKLI